MNPVKHWVRQIDRMLEKEKRYQKALGTLRGIKNTIEETGRVTRKQIAAVKNIKYGRGSHS